MWGQAQNMLLGPEKDFDRETLLFSSLHLQSPWLQGQALVSSSHQSYPTSRPPSRIEEMPILSLMKETSRNQATDSGQPRGCGVRCQTSVKGLSGPKVTSHAVPTTRIQDVV